MKMLAYIKKHRSQILTYTFYSFVIIFLIIYATSIDFSALNSQKLNYFVFFMATLVGISAIFWSALMWLFVLKNLGAKNLDKRALIYVYGKSWLGRYIPGTAPWILGKIGFASGYGIPKKKLAISSILEAIFQIIATVLVSFLLIFLSRKSIDIPVFSWVILLIGIAGSFIVIQPKVFTALVNKLMKLLKKQPIEEDNRTSLKLNIKGIALYSIGAFITGFAVFILANSITALDSYSDMLYIMGASNLAAVIGMMAIFVPSGLGVREITFVALLTVVMPVEQAVFLSIVSRLWSVLVDLLFYAIGYVTNRKNSSTQVSVP